MTWVKICGITNLEDALVALEAGADAVGFVFHEKSPRRVDVATARAIVAELPERIEKVGVFVEQSADEIREIVQRTAFTGVQTHPRPQAPHGLAESLNGTTARKFIWALSNREVNDGFVLRDVAAGSTVLLDSGDGVTPGGTGETFDWRGSAGVVGRISEALPVIVAGGLNAGNVTEAMNILRPFGVDVASGVEARAGKKDPEKVRAFVRAVREADRRVG